MYAGSLSEKIKSLYNITEVTEFFVYLHYLCCAHCLCIIMQATLKQSRGFKNKQRAFPSCFLRTKFCMLPFQSPIQCRSDQLIPHPTIVNISLQHCNHFPAAAPQLHHVYLIQLTALSCRFLPLSMVSLGRHSFIIKDSTILFRCHGAWLHASR